jgi:hypothetical protein
MGSLFDDQLKHSESQAAFCVVTVTYAHQLRVWLASSALRRKPEGGDQTT